MEYCYNENYFCDICDCDFTKNSEYLVHSIQKHGITEDEISYDCANCFQSFTLLSNFQQHIVKNNERLKTTKIQLDNAEIEFTKEKPKNQMILILNMIYTMRMKARIQTNIINVIYVKILFSTTVSY